MKLLVCGSRSINNYKYVEKILNLLDIFLQRQGKLITEIIEGDAEGVDKLSGIWGKKRGINIIEKPAKWKKYGGSAGFIRNKKMVDLCDGGVAIWDGYSTGTKHTIELLKKQKKLIRVYKSE